MRFDRNSGLDRLADALRRAEFTWQWEVVQGWDAVPESERQEWRRLAQVAASSVREEVSPAERRAASD
jgi:hypothetical protein